MAIVLYNAACPFTDALRLPERYFDVRGVALTIKQQWKDDGRGGSALGFGASVYESAFVLADWLLGEGKHLCEGRQVLELGAGLGLTSIAVSLAGSSFSVVCTDGDEDLVRQAHDNAVANAVFSCASAEWPCQNFHEAAPSGRPSPLFCTRLLWGSDDATSVLRHAQSMSEGASACAGGAPGVRLSCSGCGRDEPFIIRLVIAADVVACPYQSALAGLQRTLRHLLTRCHYCGSAIRGPVEGVEEGDLTDAFPTAVIAYKRRHASEAAFFDGCTSTEAPEEADPLTGAATYVAEGAGSGAGVSVDVGSRGSGSCDSTADAKLLRGGIREFVDVVEVPREELHPDYRALPAAPLQPIQLFRLRVKSNVLI